MRNGFVKSIAVMTSAILLASCAEMEARKAAPAATQTVRSDLRGPFDLERVKLVIHTTAPESVTARPLNLKQSLREFDVPEPGGRIGNWIRDIRQANAGKGPEQYQGLGGIPARNLIDIADTSLVGGNFSAPVNASVTGKIEQTVVLPDGGSEDGYAYDRANRTGHLWVTMFTTWQRGNSNEQHIKAERFKVVVAPRDPSDPAQGFLEESKDPEDPNDVFPDARVHTGLRVTSMTAAGFQVKLYAAGEDIQVTQYWLDRNYDGTGEPSWEHQFALGDSGIPPEFQTIFDKNQDACIDMMFASEMAPTELGPNDAPPYYCLGRCDDPPIINTR